MLLRRLIYFLLIVSLSSCSLFRKLPGETEETSNLRSAVKLHINETGKQNTILIQNASFTIESDKKISAKMTLYAERKNLIFGNIRFLGFEVARFKITRDSLFYINRLKREYLFEGIEKIGESTGFALTFNHLEDILFTGFPVVPDSRNHEFYKFAKIENDSVHFPYQLNSLNKIESIYTFPEMKLIKMNYTDIPGMVRADINIQRRKKDIERIEGVVQKEFFLAKFDLNVGEISNDTYSKTKFKIGKNYKEISNIF
jgi:hypothetical protein